MTKEAWKEMLDDFRKDRDKQPVEMFMLLLICLVPAVSVDSGNRFIAGISRTC